MKKISIFIICILMLSLTGCGPKKVENKRNSFRQNEITGEKIKANLNDNDDIIINESDITNKATYISYESDNVAIGLLAVKDSKGNVKVVVNTCQSCGGSPYAYFVQVGNKIQCQNCGNVFDIDELDNLVEDGCNPIPLEEKQSKDGIITIGTKQLKELKSKFENWNGPKA